MEEIVFEDVLNSKESVKLASAILDRYETERTQYRSRKENMLDLLAIHSIYKLDLKKMLFAKKIEFFYNLDGIKANIDRRTGFLSGDFMPMFISTTGNKNFTVKLDRRICQCQ